LDGTAVTAVPDTGYSFVDWSDASTQNPRTDLGVTGDITVTANFAIDEYTLTINVFGNGSVDKLPDQATYTYGTIVTLDTNADLGWSFDSWGGDLGGSNSLETITMDGNKTVTATFIQDQYTITASADANGVLDPNGTIFKTYGQDQQFTAAGNIGYTVDTWYLDSNSVQVGGEVYMLNNIIEDHTVYVTFKQLFLPRDNFDDNRRGALWRYYAEDYDSMRIIENVNRLNLSCALGIDLAASCVGHWKMNDNDTSTIVADSSGNGNHGTAQQNTEDLHVDSGNPPHLNGALTFDGSSDYIDVGNAIGTGAYTKVAWVKRVSGSNFNNIVSSDTYSNALYAPSSRSFRLCSGHTGSYDVVQDSEPLPEGVWCFVAVTYDPDVESGKMVLYKNGSAVDEADSVPTQAPSNKTYIGRFYTNYNFSGSIDNVMIFNKALSPKEMSLLYNSGSGTEILPEELGGPADIRYAEYTANGWGLDVTEDFAVKVDFQYSDVSVEEGWAGITIADSNSYVSISAGSDSNESYFYYEAIVDGNTIIEQELRDVNDGTLYISYDAALNELYLSHVGYGSADAYVWQSTEDPLQAQWTSASVDIAIGGASSVYLGLDDAYLDSFQVDDASLFGWTPVTDLNGDGYIGVPDLNIIANNWLMTDVGIEGGDIDHNGTGDGIVNFLDFAELGLAW
jgi:hypothetical protein